MRKKIVTAVVVGTLAVGGAAAAGPALGATTSHDGTAATSPLDRIRSALSGLVSDKTITQEQADKVAGTLSQQGIGRGGPGWRGGPGGRGGADLTAAATALGISEADLRTALRSGRTLAQVAEDENVPVDTLVAALVTTAQARIAQAVKDGRITQADADARLKDLTARITERVNGTRPTRGPGGFGRHGDGGFREGFREGFHDGLHEGDGRSPAPSTPSSGAPSATN